MKLTKAIQLPNGMVITPHKYEMIKENMERDLFHQTFQNREDNLEHAPYKKKRDFLKEVKKGNIKAIYKYLKDPCFETNNLSHLSLDVLKGKVISSVLLLSYFCTDGGVPEDLSNTIADCYIKYIETTTSKEYCLFLYYHAIIKFTSKAESYKNYSNFSESVVHCINQISKSVHEKISISELASSVNLSTRQLSRKFSSEVGCSISTYIQNERIAEAKNLLIYSDLKSIDIASYLYFCSESYFCKVFKDKTGLSPNQFRQLHKKIFKNNSFKF